MLTVRIIPCLDVRNGRVVKGVRFQGLRDAGSPAELAGGALDGLPLLPGFAAGTPDARQVLCGG